MKLLQLTAVALLVTIARAQYFGDYYCQGGKDVFVHLFEWKWADIAKECEDFLGDNGFCAVQISPPMEHRWMENYDGYINWPWWQRYQPVSYKMDSRSGTEAEFRDMVERCNAAGVWIYVDTIINHMTYGESGTGTAGSPFDGANNDYPGVPYSTPDFHGSDVCFTEDGNIHDYNNPDEVRYCRLNTLRDLRHGTEYVDAMIAEYMNKLIGWGVAGFRIDASKHMFPHHMEGIFSRLNDLSTEWFPANTKPFIFQEVIDLGGEPISGNDYTHIGRVTEFRHGMNLGDVFRGNSGQRLAYLENFGEGWGMLAGLSAVVFIDNHDNQRGHGAGGFSRILTFFEAHRYKMANAFQLAWPYGYVRVMSSYLWPREIENGIDINDWMGPPALEDGTTRDVDCSTDWICEHRWRQISNMVRFHNTVVGAPVVNWWDNDFQAIAFGRGDKGFIVFNNEDFPIEGSFATGLPDGEYCDVITCDNNVPPCGNSGGSCRNSVTVSNGVVQISLPNDDDPVFAIHV